MEDFGYPPQFANDKRSETSQPAKVRSLVTQCMIPNIRNYYAPASSHLHNFYS